MNLTIKTLKNVIYKVSDFNQEKFVLDLKQKIEDITLNEKTAFKKEEIKLVFNGQVLDDEKKLIDYKISENNIIMLMTVTAKIKKSVEGKQLEEVKKPEETKSKEALENGKPKKEIIGKVRENTDKVVNPNEFQYHKELLELNMMGFTGKKAEMALMISQGNLNTALDLLYEGGILNGEDIEDFFADLANEEDEEEEGDPNDEEAELGLDPDEADDHIHHCNHGNEDDNNDEDYQDKIEMVASIVKVMCQDDKSKLPEVLNQLQNSYPEMFELVSEYNEEFEELFHTPITKRDREIYDRYLRNDKECKEDENAHQQTEENNQNNVQGEILLSESDIESVNRLISLGFSFNESKYAFIICDKNEELAANFLFENKLKNDDNQTQQKKEDKK